MAFAGQLPPESEGLLKLHTYGLLNNSFQPTSEIRVLRTYWRQRAQHVSGAATCVQRMQKALTSVSKPRAFRIVRKALDELVQHCQDTAERVRQLELYRLDRIRLSLDPKKGDPRVADTLIRISERVAKLHGLDAPQRIEASGPNGGPIETEEGPDYSKLTLDEMLLLRAMERKASGIANWDEGLREREEFQRRCYRRPAARDWIEGLKKLGILEQQAAETQPALPAGS